MAATADPQAARLALESLASPAVADPERVASLADLDHQAASQARVRLRHQAHRILVMMATSTATEDTAEIMIPQAAVLASLARAEEELKFKKRNLASVPTCVLRRSTTAGYKGAYVA